MGRRPDSTIDDEAWPRAFAGKRDESAAIARMARAHNSADAAERHRWLESLGTRGSEEQWELCEEVVALRRPLRGRR